MRIPYLFLVCAVFVNTASANDKTPEQVSSYLRRQGPVIEHQEFHATFPNEQIVSRYCVDENLKGGKNEGASNPANVRCEIALFNRKKDWIFANRIGLGQGTIHEFKEAIVKGKSVTYDANDALCCPSKKANVIFTTAGGRLVKVQQ